MEDIKKESSTPLYEQIESLLVSRIESGVYPHGSKIPTEIELGVEFNVSRVTIRGAIDRLVKKDYVVRKQGKGTFVCSPKLERNFEEIVGYSESMARQGFTPGRVILSCRLTEDGPAYVRQFLNVPFEESIIHLKRILTANDEPMLYENAYYPQKFAFLLDVELEKFSTYGLFRERMGISPVKAIRTIGLAYADSEAAEYLHVNRGQPLLSVTEQVYDQFGDPIHYSFSLSVNERSKIQLTAYAPSSKEYMIIPDFI